MKIPRLFPLLFAPLLPLLGTAACATTERIDLRSDGGAPEQSTSSTIPSSHDAASFCSALCDRQQECDNAIDHQTCKNDCNNRQAAVFPKLRQDVVGLIVTCFGEKDCKSVLTGDVIATCAAEGVASVAPSDAAVKYCDSFANAKKKCGGATATKAPCLEQAKLYSDDAVAQAQNCTARPCNEIDTCVGASFGGFSASSSPSPKQPSGTNTTTNCTSGAFSDLGTCSSCAETACCAQASACAADSMCRSGMRICSADYGSPSSCNSYMQSTSTSTRQLLGAYFNCASSSASCGSSCGYVTP